MNSPTTRPALEVLPPSTWISESDKSNLADGRCVYTHLHRWIQADNPRLMRLAGDYHTQAYCIYRLFSVGLDLEIRSNSVYSWAMVDKSKDFTSDNIEWDRLPTNLLIVAMHGTLQNGVDRYLI